MAELNIDNAFKKSGTTFHLCVNIDYLLAKSDKELKEICSFNDDGKESLRQYLERLKHEGVIVLPIGEACDNFDDVHGCKGHRKTPP